MPRRRLQIQDSSDEEDDPQPQEPAPSVSSQPPPPQSFPSHPSAAVEISDDDDENFIDVSDHLSPPSPPVEASAGSVPPAAGAPVTSRDMEVDCPIGEYLGRMGLRLRREWLDGCVSGLQSSVPAFSSLDVATKAELCFEQFLLSDMNHSGGGVLPPNVDSLHLVDLAGPFVLQVDEIVNISCPLRGRYQSAAAGPKRCLKLSMTDGVQRVFGMEYRPIKDLEALAPAGLKVVVCNIHIRHGLLMLVPEALEVLGGVVDELEAARERVVNEVNKPPRGRRTRSGIVPSLAARATRAAWVPANVSDAQNGDRATGSGAISHTVGTGVPPEPSGISVSLRGSMESMNHASRRTSVSSTSSNVIADFQEMHVDVAAVNGTTDAAPQVSPNIERMHVDSATVGPTDAVPSSPDFVSAVGERHSDSDHLNGNDRIPDRVPDELVNDDAIEILDEVDHPVILRGNREIPFTYLASLSARWVSMKERAPSVQGKIKCFLTGVKGFQYKQRTTYELRVYVDDGSLISEIFIDHNVVEKGIGHTPEEVTVALSSPDKTKSSRMKEVLKQFQFFLANFEGIMLIEYNGTCPIPIAREMIEGCATSDAWFLLRRLKSSNPMPAPDGPTSLPIDLSP